MSGTQSSAYLSEEARLQAQRRMLAERYGLQMSDNEEEDDASATTSDDTVEAPEMTDAASTMTPGATTAPNGSVLRTGAVSCDGLKAPLMSPPLRSPLKSPSMVMPDSPTASGASWPGVNLVEGGTAPAAYTYVRTDERKSAGQRRKNKVMPVAMYSSQLLPGHGRKIAVNESVVTYVVGGHIRGIVRNSSILALLKGHTATVMDMEFLSAQEKRLGDNGPACSVLGSVAEDGLAYVWRLLRQDAPEGTPHERGTFEIADYIPIRHPNAEHGGTYSRVAFRPGSGSVIADNGVGVALLLVDPESADLRVVEIVKMDQKVMARDHILSSANEPTSEHSVGADVAVRACLWLNEKVAVVARGSSVVLWEFEEKRCLGHLRRTASSKVTSLHSLNEGVLLVAADEGRTLEIWLVGDGDFRLSQSFQVSPPDSSEPFLGVVSVDPGSEIVTVANTKGLYMLVLHYSQAQRRFDTITEVATAQPMLSITLTRAPSAKASKDSLVRTSSKPVDEVGLWYVQPRGIHMMMLKVKHYAPPAKGDDFSTPSSLASSASIPAKMLVLDPSLANKSPSQAAPAPTVTAPTVGLGSRSFETRKSPLSATPPADELSKPPAVTILQAKRAASKASPDSRNAVEPKSTDTKLLDVVTSNKSMEASKSLPTPPPVVSQPAPSVDADEVAEAMLDAAKRAIEQFEERARQKDENEAARTEKLLKSVRESAEANMERAVNTALKNCMGNIIIPNVSTVLTRMAPDEKSTSAGAQKEMYAEAMASSNLLAMYEAGCSEILEQVGSAVQRSMDDKCSTLVNPAVRTIQDAAADITQTVEALVKQLEQSSLQQGGVGANGTGATEPDVRAKATVLLDKGRTDDAFNEVLGACDLEALGWLVKKFDPMSFFDSHKLSQICKLSLAQQIGQRLGPKDPEAKASVEWLREVMLCMAPQDASIAASVRPALSEIGRKVSALQKDQTLNSAFPGIGKELKQLGMVIMSLSNEEQ